MSIEQFQAEVKQWLATAKDPRWHRPYTELTYLPMIELLTCMRANGYKTYIATGGGQAFVHVYAEKVYGIPPEQVVGTAGGVTYGYDKSGKPFLTKDSKLLLNDDNAGKPEGLRLRPGARAARHQGRDLPPVVVRRGEGPGLGRHQHDERLEERLRVRGRARATGHALLSRRSDARTSPPARGLRSWGA